MNDFSKSGKLVDSLAIRAYKRSKPVESIDIQLTELQAEVVILRSDLLNAQNAISQLQNDYAALLANYNAHTHSYQDATIADTADGTGVLTETTKTTTIKA